MYKTNKVYWVTNELIETYIERPHVDKIFIAWLQTNKHIIVYGASKQWKTSLTNKHLEEKDSIKVNCSPKTTVLDIFNSIVRQLDVTILDTKEIETEVNWKITVSIKSKIKIPLLFEWDSNIGWGWGKSEKVAESFKQVEYNLGLAQDLSELLRNMWFKKRIILENFHYLDINVQQQLAMDLRIFEDYNILFIILWIWREKNRLSQFNWDLQDRVIEVPVEPWEKEDLHRIVDTWRPLLNVSFKDIIDKLVDSCFDSVWVFQEICKECCLTAWYEETQQELVFITEKDLRNAIESKLESYSSRHIRALEAFIEQKAKSSKDIPLYIPYYFVKILASEKFDDITSWLKRKTIQEKIKDIHHRPNDVRASDMWNFLSTLVASQVKKNISPPIFDYDISTSSVKIIDSTFYFFLKNYNRNDIINYLQIPEWLDK